MGATPGEGLGIGRAHEFAMLAKVFPGVKENREADSGLIRREEEQVARISISSGEEPIGDLGFRSHPRRRRPGIPDLDLTG